MHNLSDHPCPHNAASQYWLHVANDGVEVRYERCPIGLDAKPTLNVIVARRFERTRTYDVLVPHGKYLKWIIVRPRGRGWMRAGRGIDPGNRELCIGQRRWTEWRRKIVP